MFLRLQEEMSEMGSEQKTIQMPSGKPDAPKYDWSCISAENRLRIKQRDKAIETADIDEMNAICAEGEYYYDRFSDTRGKFLLIRRERTGR